MKQFSTNQIPGSSARQGQNNWDYYDPQFISQQNALPPSVKQVTPQGGMARIAIRQRKPWIKWAAALALIVLLGAFGSTNIFAGGGGGGTGTGQISPTATTAPRPTVLPTPTSTTSAPSPTAVPASPTPGMTPQPSPGGQAGSRPPSWTASGRGDAEFIEAKNVVETFVSHYEMLDWRSRNTFDQATFAMTQAALSQRFLHRDCRANEAFVNNFIQGRKILMPSLNSNLTSMLAAQAAPRGFFIWMSVSYSLLHQQKSGTSFTDQHTIVVLLVNTPFGVNSVVGGVGWLVSDWREGTDVFPIPDQP